jgi:hypothetical protein
VTPRAWRFAAFVLGGITAMAAVLAIFTSDAWWCSGGLHDACVAPDRPLHRTRFVLLAGLAAVGFAAMLIAAAAEVRVRRRTLHRAQGGEPPPPRP